MPTDFETRKLVKWFESFDFDADGVIGQLDLTAKAQLWCDVYEVPPLSEGWVSIHGSMLDMWNAIRARAGANGHDSLTVDEWVRWKDRADFPSFVEEAAIPHSMAVFHVADGDGDGRITVDEMMAAQRKSGMSREETIQAFSVLDSDGDGLVTAAEFESASRDFYLSDDPQAPGNLLAGDY